MSQWEQSGGMLHTAGAMITSQGPGLQLQPAGALSTDVKVITPGARMPGLMLSDVGRAAAMTRIVLPLRNEQRAGSGGVSLLQRFDDVQPQLLLFLQRLRRIAVTRAHEGWADVMQRRAVGRHVVELRVTRVTLGAGSHTFGGQAAAVQVTAAAPEASAVAAPAGAAAPAAATAATDDGSHTGLASDATGAAQVPAEPPGQPATASTPVQTLETHHPPRSATSRLLVSEHWLVVRSHVAPSLPRLDVRVPETEVCLAFLLTDEPSATAKHPVSDATHPVSDARAAGVTGAQEVAGSSQQGMGQGLLGVQGHHHHHHHHHVWRPEQQPVFAFLPLRSYGLRFVVQVRGVHWQTTAYLWQLHARVGLRLNAMLGCV